MNETSTAINGQEQVLAEFMLAYETAIDKSAVRREFCDRYPELAGEIGSLADMQLEMDAARPVAEVAPRLAAGHRLGPFRILRFLAAGGMGEVYRASQEGLDRDVALKVIRRGAASSSACDRFEREQRVLARLHQTHIVPIHANGEQDGLQYFAMHHIDGMPLHKVVRTAYVLETSANSGHAPSLEKLVDSMVSPPDAKAATTYVQPATNQPTASAEPAAPAPMPKPDVAARLTLTPAYFRSVANVMAQAAEALQHAHDENIFHRDIKPSNLMVDRDGQCWIIDFGLAGFLDRPAETIAAGNNSAVSTGARTHGPLGTPAYMAPEQHRGEPERRSDVWSLGATLYELLTLRPAFAAPTPEQLEERIRTTDPNPMRGLVANLPPDLAAICRMALRKEPAERYQSAGELAADLRRWFGFMPTLARPAHTLRRVALWARRNKGWATAMVCAIVASVGLALTTYLAANARANFATALAEKETARAQLFENEIKERDRTAMLQDSQRRRLTRHIGGWSKECWSLTDKIAKLGSRDDLRDQAAATLLGLDAKVIKRFVGNPAWSVAFHPDSQRVLIGGWELMPPIRPALLWDSTTGKADSTKVPGQGPVIFRTDGTPLQLVPPTKDRGTIQLWNVATQQKLQEIAMKDALPAIDSQLTYERAIFSADGSSVVVVASKRDDTGKVIQSAITLFESTSGRRVRQIEQPATGVAVTPDGSLLAIGDDDGVITIWPMPEGEALARLPGEPLRIHGLAFGRSVKRAAPTQLATALTPWLLASGDDGGTVTVWNLERRAPQAFCRGSNFAAYAVAFSPDGMTLASAGRRHPRLWDVATGELLLELDYLSNTMTDIAFSPDGKKLAVTGLPIHTGGAGVAVLELESSRGLRSLRGLSGEIVLYCATPDCKSIAALSNNWQAAVWSDGGDKLRHKFEVPKGPHSDNLALALSPDGQRFVCAAGDEARMWNVETGQLMESWKLPPGLANKVAFHSSGKLLLLRSETKDAKRYPTLGANPRDYPRVCRIRELQSAHTVRLIKEIEDHNWHVFETGVAPNGDYFVVSGLSAAAKALQRSMKAYDGLTGDRLWTMDEAKADGGHSFTFDPSGKVMAFFHHGTNPRVYSLVEMPSRKLIETRSEFPLALGPGTREWIEFQDEPHSGIGLCRPGSKDPIVRLGIDHKISGQGMTFSTDGSRVVWGNNNGTVTVADLPEINRRLSSIGLGW